jgi:hypothetical protein
LQELKPNDLNSLPFSDGSRVGTWYAEQVTSGYAVQSRMASAAAVATGATTASVTVAAPIRKEAKAFFPVRHYSLLPLLTGTKDRYRAI